MVREKRKRWSDWGRDGVKESKRDGEREKRKRWSD